MSSPIAKPNQVDPNGLRTVQLAIFDKPYRASLRTALSGSGGWQAVSKRAPDFAQRCVVVLDEPVFVGLTLPFPNPERVVLILRPDSHLLARAWDAGIRSVVSPEDPVSTVLLAIMAAALRIARTAASNAMSSTTPLAQ